MNQRGQTLLEVLLAFSVSILVLSAVILGIITSLSNTQYTKNQGLADSYAQEGVSVIRKIRDSSWYDFSNNLKSFTTNVKYCLDKDLKFNEVSLTQNCSGNVYGVGASGIFSREVVFEHNSSSCCPDNTKVCDISVRGSKITVTVSWSDGKCPVGTPLCHKVDLITCLANADQKQNP
jgi:Tfp pilus assembly protein PilV